MGPIARTQAVSTPNVLCQPSSDTSDSLFHATNSPIHPLHAHEPRFWAARWPKYGPYSPWRFRLVDQQPASGLLALGILALSSAIQPLAMLEPKYSMVPRLLCSLRALHAMLVAIVHFSTSGLYWGFIGGDWNFIGTRQCNHSAMDALNHAPRQPQRPLSRH